MNDLPTDPKTFAQAITMGALGLFFWFFKRHVTHFAQLRGRVEKLRETSVSRKELTDIFNQLREDRLNMHQENKEAIQSLILALDRVHDRVDTIFQREPRHD